jgi:hypothetical protein
MLLKHQPLSMPCAFSSTPMHFSLSSNFSSSVMSQAAAEIQYWTNEQLITLSSKQRNDT